MVYFICMEGLAWKEFCRHCTRSDYSFKQEDTATTPLDRQSQKILQAVNWSINAYIISEHLEAPLPFSQSAFGYSFHFLALKALPKVYNPYNASKLNPAGNGF
jgi:hypothetical protein